MGTSGEWNFRAVDSILLINEEAVTRRRARGGVVLDRELLDILACPVCKTPLTYNEKANTLKCGQCRRVYPIREEIPVLLVDEATIEEP